MPRTLTTPAAFLALVSCAGLSDRAKAVRQVKADQVGACYFVQRIDAGYVPHSAASKLETEAQRNEALEKAAAAGATHVVWDERHVMNRVLITAGAYRCSGAMSASTPR